MLEEIRKQFKVQSSSSVKVEVDVKYTQRTVYNWNFYYHYIYYSCRFDFKRLGTKDEFSIEPRYAHTKNLNKSEKKNHMEGQN